MNEFNNHEFSGGRIRNSRLGRADLEFHEEDHYPTEAKPMKKRKARFDDDLRNIPQVRSSLPKIDGQLTIFTGKGDLAVVKIDKERPDVIIAAESLELDKGSTNLLIDAKDGCLGIVLGVMNPQSKVVLYDSNVINRKLAQRNIDANAGLVSNVTLVDDTELEKFVSNNPINNLVFDISGYTSIEYIRDRILFAKGILSTGGRMFCITHQKFGGERHEAMLKEIFGAKDTTITARGRGGYRIFEAVNRPNAKTKETGANIRKEISFSILNKKFSVLTEVGLFSKEDLDIGTRTLLENTDLTHYQRLLDIGCGWGAIGLVATSINSNGRCIMTDVDARAVSIANLNAQHLGLSDRASAVATEDLRTVKGNFDLILTNPPFHADTKVLEDMFKGARDKLEKKGNMFIVVEATYLKKISDILDTVFGRHRSIKEPINNFYVLSVSK